MANHKSSLKRIRQSEARKVHNKYFARTTRNAIKKLKDITDKKEASEMLPTIEAMLDKLAKVNIIHKNKAGRQKARLNARIKALVA